MKQYLISLNAVREKVFIIKLVRAITHWGLADSKHWTEANFTFDTYMTDRAEFDMTVTAEQLGHITAFTLEERNIRRCIIDSVKEVYPNHDQFDLTNCGDTWQGAES